MASSQMAAKPKKPFNLRKWIRSRQGQQAIVIVSFMIIPLALLLVFTYLPFAEMFKFSFYKMKYVGERQTLYNFTYMWTLKSKTSEQTKLNSNSRR